MDYVVRYSVSMDLVARYSISMDHVARYSVSTGYVLAWDKLLCHVAIWDMLLWNTSSWDIIIFIPWEETFCFVFLQIYKKFLKATYSWGRLYNIIRLKTDLHNREVSPKICKNVCWALKFWERHYQHCVQYSLTRGKIVVSRITQ